MSDNNRFNPFEINLLRPIDASAKATFWAGVGIPLGVAFIWGIYNPENISSVFGIAARRATGAAIEETKPIGESLVNGTNGNGLKPGSNYQMDRSVRPSEARNLGQ